MCVNYEYCELCVLWRFQDLFGVLLTFLAEALGSAFTPEMKDAWAAAGDTIVSIIKSIEI